MTEAIISGYDGTGRKSAGWWPSRYGAEDSAGTGNELTPERVLRALRIPVSGRVVELAQTVEPGIAVAEPRTWALHILSYAALAGSGFVPGEGTSDATAFDEQAELSFHVGCHVDGLGHVGIAGRFYNGTRYEDFYSPTGHRRFGMEGVRSWMTRGVCLDVAGLIEKEIIEEGFVIGPDHLDGACHRQGIDIGAGDVVLLHTGWGSLWSNDAKRYGANEPGLGWEGAHWLTARRVSAVGADNWALEVIPFERAEHALVVHQHLLAETGTYIIENLRTSELVREDRSEFLFAMSPLKIKGSTASMVSPVAVL
jgi:kynurenine formamidase